MDGPSTEEIETALANLTIRQQSHDPAKASQAVTLLSIQSRTDATIRERLADPKALRTLIEVVESGLGESLETTLEALRCIGNACIDNDPARDVFANDLSFSWARLCLQQSDNELQRLTVKVLYNICSDHAAAQEECFRQNLHCELIRMLSLDYPAPEDGELESCIDLVFWICEHKPSPEQPSEMQTLSSETLRQLLDLPDLFQSRVDPDSFAALIETNLVFLRDATVQARIVEEKMIDRVWNQLSVVDRVITELEHLRETQAISRREEEADSIKLLLPLFTSLTWVLSDIAASSIFPTHYPLEDRFVLQMMHEIYWDIESSVVESSAQLSRERILNGILQVIGNLLWSLDPQTYTFLVKADSVPDFYAPYLRQPGLHSTIFSIISHARSSDLLHSAAGMVIQLSRPGTDVRSIIGSDDNALDAVKRLCHHEMVELRQDAIKVLKALGKNCPPNQEKFEELAKVVMASLSQAANTTGDTDMTEASPR